ncbi:Hypothetical protein NTJ_03895 [Nesidiocoris tenuis]|uniref:Uncharacterized protein n=1 Tax=Nesidiocoris tenuis TaxID=355587 RepID=A0ABN7AFM9_9HEMI|nr:Hypothetical protein NTJ_03895 [Nesidiocoris tenuis]
MKNQMGLGPNRQPEIDPEKTRNCRVKFFFFFRWKTNKFQKNKFHDHWKKTLKPTKRERGRDHSPWKAVDYTTGETPNRTGRQGSRGREGGRLEPESPAAPPTEDDIQRAFPIRAGILSRIGYCAICWRRSGNAGS